MLEMDGEDPASDGGTDDGGREGVGQRVELGSRRLRLSLGLGQLLGLLSLEAGQVAMDAGQRILGALERERLLVGELETFDERLGGAGLRLRHALLQEERAAGGAQIRQGLAARHRLLGMDEELLGIVQAAHREADRPLRRLRMDKGLWHLVARRWTARWFPPCLPRCAWRRQERPQQDFPLGDVQPVQVGFLQIMQRSVAQLDLGMTDPDGLELIDGEGRLDVLRRAHDANEVSAAIRRDEGQQIPKHLRMEMDDVEADVERWPSPCKYQS